MTNEEQRSGRSCKQAAGTVRPVIDRNRCEGKAGCVAVCPNNVFVLGVLPQAERSGLSLKGKLKGVVHGWKQALMPNVSACEGCGLCIAACPEKAISLLKSGDDSL